MSQENVEITRRGYRAFAGGDPTKALSFLDPEIETYDFPEVPDTGVYRGQQGFVTLVENVVGEFEDFRLEPEEFTALDEDHVLVIARTLGRGKGSGVDVEARVAHLWTIRDGKAIRLQLFGTREEALAAVGLSE